MTYASNRFAQSRAQIDAGSAPNAIDFADILRMVRRNLWLITTFGLIGLLAGVGFVSVRPKSFIATTTLQMDARAIRVLQDAYVMTPGSHAGDSHMLSQIEFIRSDAIVTQVVDTLRLDDGTIGTKIVKSTWQTLASIIADKFHIHAFASAPSQRVAVGMSPTNSRTARLEAVDIVKDNLRLAHVPRTGILHVSYRSSDPAFSMRVANAVADAYIADQQEGNRRAANRAVQWISDQLREIREQLAGSEATAQKLRSERNLVATGGQLISEQQLTETHKQLTAARSEVGTLSARHAKLSTLVDGPISDAVLGELTNDPFLSKLRERHIHINSSLSAATIQLGAHHQAVVRLRDQMSENSRLMRLELQRVLTTLQNELDVARKNEQRLAAEITELVRSSTDTVSSQSELHNLDSRNDGLRAIYKDFLQRLQSARQQQSFDEITARVITRASQTDGSDTGVKERPASVIVMFASILGAMLGGGLGLFREFTDNTFRSRNQVRNILGATTVWMLPRIALPRRKHTSWRGTRAPEGAAVEKLGETKAGTAGNTTRGDDMLHHVLDHADTDLSRMLAVAKLDIDNALRDSERRIVGITSAFAEEGKTVVAKNLASLLAASGTRTVLVDCDPVGRGLTQALAPHAEAGLRAAANTAAEEPLHDLLYIEQETGLRVLPATLADHKTNVAGWFATTAFKRLLERLGTEFEYVVLDLPAMSKRLEVHAVAPHIDGFVFIAAWGRSPRDHMVQLLENEPEMGTKCLGVALTLVDAQLVPSYDSHGALH